MAKRAILAGVDAGATAHLGTDITQMLSYFLDGDSNSGSGVLNKSADHLEVTESATPAMTVDVTAGVGFIKDNNTDDFLKKLRIGVLDADHDDTLVVTANATGSNRIDAVVAYVDLGASSSVRGLDVLCFAVVAGTGTSAMSDAVVQTAVDALVSGYSDVPWMRLADLTVANGASSIVNANIADVRTQAVFTSSKYNVQYDSSTHTEGPTSLGASTELDLATVTITLAQDSLCTVQGNLTVREHTGVVRVGVRVSDTADDYSAGIIAGSRSDQASGQWCSHAPNGQVYLTAGAHTFRLTAKNEDAVNARNVYDYSLFVSAIPA